MYSSKKYVSIALLSLAPYTLLFGMHQPTSNNSQEQLEFSLHDNSHTSIESYIATHFPTAETLEQFTTDLIEKSRTDTALEQALQNPEFTHNLITYLSARFGKNYLECALLLNTPESITCCNNKLKDELLTTTQLDKVILDCINTHNNTAVKHFLPLVSSEHYLPLLQAAIIRKNIQAITLILRQAEALLRQPGNPLLLYAQEQFISAIIIININNRTLVQAFLEGGFNPSFVGQYGSTPLHHAIRRNDIDLALLLIEHGADVNQAINHIYPEPLVLALQPDINLPLFFIEFLVHAGANTTSINQALAKAVERNRIDVVKLLMRQPNVNVNYSDAFTPSPLIIAIRNNRQAIAQLLLKHPRINVEQRDNTGFGNSLEYALRNDNRVLAHALLNKGANPNNIPHWSIGDQEHRVLNEICDERVHMNQAAKQGQVQAIHKLRSQSIPLTPRAVRVLQDLYTKFFDVLTTGNIEWVKWAIKCGLSVNIHGPEGNTPLHIAVMRSLRLNPSDFNNSTAYQTAVQQSQELIKLLLLVGADPTITNNNRQTPVHLAADKPHLLNLFISFAHRHTPYRANSATPGYVNPDIQWPAPADVPRLLEPQSSTSKSTCTIS